jgi:hypothetical protein
MQDLRRKRLVLAQQTQQQVFGSDVLVAQALSLFRAVRQHALAFVT